MIPQPTERAMTEELRETIATAAFDGYWSTLPNRYPRFTWEQSEEHDTWFKVADAVLAVLRPHLGPGELTTVDTRFVEAVRKAFHRMTIHNAEDTACWYTLRDWLKAQDSPAIAGRGEVGSAEGESDGQTV